MDFGFIDVSEEDMMVAIEAINKKHRKDFFAQKFSEAIGHLYDAYKELKAVERVYIVADCPGACHWGVEVEDAFNKGREVFVECMTDKYVNGDKFRCSWDLGSLHIEEEKN